MKFECILRVNLSTERASELPALVRIGRNQIEIKLNWCELIQIL